MEGVAKVGESEGIGLRRALPLLVAYLFAPLSLRLGNSVLYPLFDSVFPLARDVNVGTGILVYLLALACALHAPRLLRSRALGPVAVLLALAGSALMAAGISTGSAPLLCVGAVVQNLGSSWVMLFVTCACCTLPARLLIAGIPLASLAGYLAAWLVQLVPSDTFALVVLALCPLASFALAGRVAQGVVADIAAAPAQSEAMVLRPASYLPLTSRMFVCMLLATAALGFNLRVGPTEGGPVGLLPYLVSFGAIALLGVFGGLRRLYDDLFRVAVVLALAAFLVMPLSSYLGLAQNLLGVAAAFFDTVFALVLMAAAGRNRLSALAVFAWGSLMQTIGSIVGANLGAMAAAQAGNQAVYLASGLVATALVAYVLFGLDGFSFTETVEGIQPVQPLEVPEDTDVQRFEATCARVAAAAELTPREAEVLALLARGRNNAYVQEQLTLTRNTVKTYIKRIYNKLGVHSQQELIDLVEKG